MVRRGGDERIEKKQDSDANQCAAQNDKHDERDGPRPQETKGLNQEAYDHKDSGNAQPPVHGVAQMH